jgi:DNA replication ATP-dependent helicase Dna2
MDDDFGLTQDCVEWNDENAAGLQVQLDHTPAHHGAKKDYSPNQEIEDLWKQLGTPSQKSSQPLLRANSFPLPRRQNRRKQNHVGERKRKRPLSANTESNVLQPPDESNQQPSASFEELLRQLDTVRKSPAKTANTFAVPRQDPSNPSNPDLSKFVPRVKTATIAMLPPRYRISALPTNPSSVPPQKKGDLMNSTIPTLFDPLTLSSTSTPNLVSATVPPVPPTTITPIAKDLPSAQLKESNDFDASSNPLHTRQKSAIGSEFDDDFNLSEADITALDALMASQNETKIATSQVSAVQNIIRYEQKELGAADPVFAGDFDDEFGDFDIIDFADLDVQIEQKLKGGTMKPPRESFGDPFGDTFDFSELDKTIADRKQKCSSTSQEGIFRVDVSSLQIPPCNAKVSNTLDPNYDPNRSAVAFSRYQVVAVIDDTDTYTKAVLVKSWRRETTDEARSKVTLHRSSSLLISDNTQKVESSVGEGWIFLRGEWYHTFIEPEDSINLCSLSGRYQTNLEGLPVMLHTSEPTGSDKHDDLFLVVHPDTLVPPTIVSETISCSRRAVLRSRLGSTGISCKAALYGTMRHLLFEKCMNSNDFSIAFAKASVLAIVRQTAENLVALGIKEAEAQKEVLRVLPQLQEFRSAFMDAQTHSLDKAAKVDGNGVSPGLKVIVRSVEGTEESLVSPEFGLKGNIDVVVTATTQDVPSPFVQSTTDPETCIVGIELKTGHNQNPQNVHMAQLALYTLMLSVSYGRSLITSQHASKTGVLLYLNQEGMRAIRVSPKVKELQSLIGQRNVVANELKKASAPRGVKIDYDEEADEENSSLSIGPANAACLPDVLSGPQSCNRCYTNRECMLYAAAALTTLPKNQTSMIQRTHVKILDHFCGHLEPEDLQYFLDWDRLIDLEADATAKSISTAWLTPSHELEKSTGRTVSSLVLGDCFASTSQNEVSSEWTNISLYRSSDAASKTDFSTLKMEPGSVVVLSVDSTSIASSSEEKRKRNLFVKRSKMHVARGLIQSVHDSKIVVKVSVQERRQLSKELETAKLNHGNLKLRLDRDDSHVAFGKARQNLINLFTGDVSPFLNSSADSILSQNRIARNRRAWLRNTVVKLHAPQYDPTKIESMFGRAKCETIPGCDIISLEQEFHLLNEDQRNAVKKVFSAKDYSLVQGLPGTGKSSTIVFVARLLAAHGKRVLITSYTHAAVDNLMMKLIDKGVSASTNGVGPRIIRVANKGSSHLAVHPILLSEVALTLQQSIEATANSPSSDVLQMVLSRARIIGVTALSIPGSPVLLGQDFDVVIVDEAGQISQPTIIGALMAAESFVLVGDHKQLPPLVTSKAAEKAGYGVSMLSRLAEKHDNCVAKLTLQYRMHEDICQICNDIVYAGQLKCANETVQFQALHLSRFQESDSWVSRIVSPKKPVVFADTDFFDRDSAQGGAKQLVGLECRPEKSSNGNMVNDHEVSIVRRIVQELLTAGLPASSIGIISPFRAQIRRFNESSGFSQWKTCGLEISTIDSYQGRDKQVIIISFVRSNSKGFSGRLLNDFRRLNVAVSRAMKKLILVGSYFTLHSGSDVLRPVLEGFSARKQLEKIPEHILRSQLS